MNWKAELKKEGFSELAIEEIEKYLDARCIDKSTEDLANLIAGCYEYYGDLRDYAEKNHNPMLTDWFSSELISRMNEHCVWAYFGEYLFYYPEDDRL